MNNQLIPDKHGIYDKTLAEQHVYNNKGILIIINLLEIRPGAWIEAVSLSITFLKFERKTVLVEVPSKTFKIKEQAWSSAKKDVLQFFKSAEGENTCSKEDIAKIDHVTNYLKTWFLKLSDESQNIVDRVSNYNSVGSGQLDLFGGIK